MANSEFSTRQIVMSGAAGLITLLVAINAFFIKGLVDKIEKVDEINIRLSSLETKIEIFTNEMRRNYGPEASNR